MNGVLLSGIITTVASLVILLFLSIWIGLFGMIVGISLIVGGVIKGDKNE